MMDICPTNLIANPIALALVNTICPALTLAHTLSPFRQRFPRGANV